MAIAREICAERLGGTVLEIGVGSGSVAQRLLANAPELSWTAIDIDPHMTHAAAARLAGFPNAAVKTADATRLPFSDGSFDSVVSCLMLHHIIDWESAIAEVARVLRPGGIFVGYDLTRTTLASVLHRLDRSPHRLIAPKDFHAECARHGLTTSLQSQYLGHFMRWSAYLNTEEI